MSFVIDLLSNLFGDPIICDVDDDYLPLPEHRNNTQHSSICDEPEMKRLRTEKASAMPAIVKAQRDSAAALRSSSTSTSVVKSSTTSSTRVTSSDADIAAAAAADATPSAKAGAKRGRSSSAAAVAAGGSTTSPSSSSSKAKSSPIIHQINGHVHGHRKDKDGDDNKEPNETWTVAELKTYAQEYDISLAGATRKTEILDKVLESRSI